MTDFIGKDRTDFLASRFVASELFLTFPLTGIYCDGRATIIRQSLANETKEAEIDARWDHFAQFDANKDGIFSKEEFGASC